MIILNRIQLGNNQELQKIENDILIVKSKPLGGELTSIFNKKTNLEYLWQAGNAWPKHAPVLFPIVGQLKDNIYFHNGKKYKLDRHGFARTKNFELSKEQNHSVEYNIAYNDETMACFPFQFDLKIGYELSGASLKIVYTVSNVGNDEMFFSIGGHPAFRVPLKQNESYDDYYLEFNSAENSGRWLLDNGLLNNKVLTCLQNTNILPLNKLLFYEDALVFKNLKSDFISLKSKKHEHGLNFKFKNFPFFGIWAAKDADFICLEPWHGVTDNIASDQQLKNKEGIISLQPGTRFYCEYAVDTF